MKYDRLKYDGPISMSMVVGACRAGADDDVVARGAARGVPQARLARGGLPHPRAHRAARLAQQQR